MNKSSNKKKQIKIKKREWLYLIPLILGVFGIAFPGYAALAMLFAYWPMLVITIVYLIFECFVGTNIKNKKSKWIINIIDMIFGIILFWNPMYIAIKIYEYDSRLYILLGIIYCGIPFIKSWISKNKKSIIYWIRFITRIAILIAFIIVLESCSSSAII